MLVDPFNGGEVCFLEDAEERLNKLFSPRKVSAAGAHAATTVLGAHLLGDPGTAAQCCTSCID